MAAESAEKIRFRFSSRSLRLFSAISAFQALASPTLIGIA